MSSIFPSKNKSLDMACRRDFKHSLVHHVPFEKLFSRHGKSCPGPELPGPGKIIGRREGGTQWLPHCDTGAPRLQAVKMVISRSF
jgi:hypothetical protein